ncbi:MAG: hypothetical protein ACYC67_00895 [Prosthecobacter sp.]
MRKQQRNKKSAPPPTKFSIADKLKIIGFLILFFVVPTLLWHFYSIHLQEASISKTVEEWKTIYHINDEQAARIKKIELDFHGNGSPFSFSRVLRPGEKHHHHEGISRLMSTEDGARFMKAMEKSQSRH